MKSKNSKSKLSKILCGKCSKMGSKDSGKDPPDEIEDPENEELVASQLDQLVKEVIGSDGNISVVEDHTSRVASQLINNILGNFEPQEEEIFRCDKAALKAEVARLTALATCNLDFCKTNTKDAECSTQDEPGSGSPGDNQGYQKTAQNNKSHRIIGQLRETNLNSIYLSSSKLRRGGMSIKSSR